MGNMKIFLIFGYERWGRLKPESACIDGMFFKPLFFGIWIRFFKTAKQDAERKSGKLASNGI